MTTLTREFKKENDTTWGDVAELWGRLPEDRPRPVTPETIRAMTDLLATVYGDALKTLEKN